MEIDALPIIFLLKQKRIKGPLKPFWPKVGARLGFDLSYQ